MKNRIGCSGWVILIFILLFIVSILVTYWYIFAGIAAALLIILCLLFIKNKKNVNPVNNKAARHKNTQSPIQARSIQLNNKSNSIKAHKKNIAYNIDLPEPLDFHDVTTYAETAPNVIEIDDGKYINSRSGALCASASSVESTREKILFISKNYHQQETLKHFIKMAKTSQYDNQEAIKEYFKFISTPFYEGGLLAYKLSDYKAAEKWWLSILNIDPINVSKKLSTMYKKEKRYQDNEEMLKWALEAAGERLLSLEENDYQKLAAKYDRACKMFENNPQQDQSIGIKEYPNRADMNFVLNLKQLIN